GYAITECIVDTGSPYSIISDALWKHFKPGVVTPLPFDPRTPQRHRVIAVAGGRYPFTLGQLTLQLEDSDHTILPITIIAQLIQDNGRLPMALTLGLRGGFLEGRKLLAEPDATLPFGQIWTITQP
ncbi:MAG: hypothetical protein L0241_15995, partial [Planctomycetia bacterium]|nr:hypothetical protein [Planctomycetia bacterium]